MSRDPEDAGFDPFGEDAPLAPTRGAVPSVSAKPGTDEWRKQLADYASSGFTDMDSYVAAKASTAGKGRRKRPNFMPYAVKHYAERGLVFQRKEQAIYLRGCDFPMMMDYLGLFDGLVQDGTTQIGVQICPSENVQAHLRKWASETRCMAGNRRRNLFQWWRQGNRAVILHFWQEGGKGSKWQWAEREITEADILAVDARRRKKVA